ncbi:FAD/NAD(P)-binding domain-containing protein [Lentithecium fluviatile CBS 122367]|uniref:FAD/NAD(P)-binding domain-containing protein n=1 Tax=Lentithecium fluviatile CBS 122367 TaxID=1168545 RepID=A0A6G1JMP0_9PLEO|nr:FAD/NAD(P)-binding domain-containing protein [Lentithecium fluviatile CBS 122367]
MAEENEAIEKCRRHVDSLLKEKGHAELKETSYPSNSLNFLHGPNATPSTQPITLPNTSSFLPPPQASIKLKILIAGAGLGGLATAIALRLRGHTITVFEKALELGEVGAGIQIPPNSSRLLLSWGLGPYLQELATEPEAIRMRRWQNGEVISLTRLKPGFRERFGAPYYVVHRANLQISMYKRALELGVDVRVGKGVKGYDGGRARVVLENGEVCEGDLVVAADGIRSEARRVVLGGVDQAPQKPGYAAYRAMVDVELMKGDPDVEWLLESPGQNLWVGNQRHVMTYTIANNKSFNMVLSHPEDSDPSTWNQATVIEDMQQHFKEWDPRLVKVINMIRTTLKWPLLSGKPLYNWISSSGTLLILGDAAHPMVPYMSEGAAMAVEDGAALAEILSLVESPAQISDALKVFERVRILRAGQMQEASLVNGKLWHFPDGPEQRARDAAMKPDVDGVRVGESANQWSDEMTAAWAYGYDAEVEARRAWIDSQSRSSRL